MKSRSIDVGVVPQKVWDALTTVGMQRWYFALEAEGPFETGAHVRWVVPKGPPAEEGEVVAVEAPSRLEMKTRLLFEPTLAAQPPHTTVWKITPNGSGSAVSMSWEAGPLIDRLLEAEADNVLRGLRLEVDPAARAELERLPEIGEVEILDVTPERLADY